jgi:hypothetical protein
MYKPASTFVFPRLVFLKDVSFRSWSEQSKTTKLYKLDWDGFDEAILKRHIDWNAQCWPSTKFPFIQKFDSYYEGLLQSLRFTISNNYLTEIRRMTQTAMTEWGINRPFDTNIKEMCHGPAIKCIQVAFELIADCAYDEKDNYFLRVDNKYLIAPLLMFRFWQHQTGSHMIGVNSDFHKLQSLLDGLKDNKNYFDEKVKVSEITSLDRFLGAFNGQAEAIQKVISDGTKIEATGSVGTVLKDVPAATITTKEESRPRMFI